MFTFYNKMRQSVRNANSLRNVENTEHNPSGILHDYIYQQGEQLQGKEGAAAALLFLQSRRDLVPPGALFYYLETWGHNQDHPM